MKYLTFPLNKSHLKNNFFSGSIILDNYLKRQANQDIKKKLSACYILSDDNNKTIKGYYTLSNSGLPASTIPKDFKRKLPPSYTSLPTTLIGRLAVDKQYSGKGIGKQLLIDALKRAYDISKKIASFAVIVDPIDENAIKFYHKYGFILLPDSGKMFIAMKTLSKLFD